MDLTKNWNDREMMVALPTTFTALTKTAKARCVSTIKTKYTKGNSTAK